MSTDPKFVELTADVLEIFLKNTLLSCLVPGLKYQNRAWRLRRSCSCDMFFIVCGYTYFQTPYVRKVVSQAILKSLPSSESHGPTFPLLSVLVWGR